VATEADDPQAVLLAVGSVAHREIAIDDLLRRMVDSIAEGMSADRGTIYLLDRGKGELVSRAAHLPELGEIRLALGQGIAGAVAATGEVVNVPMVSDEQRFFAGVDRQTGYRTESLLAAPLRDHAGAVLGVVQLLNKRGGRFTHEDEVRLGAFAAQAALILEATTMYAALSREPAKELAPLPLAAQFNRIVGESEGLRQACRLTSKAAASSATVLIRGESGTGKELFARAIHVNSARSEGPFVKVDCAALPETLIENELFGHERGAYTGADTRAPGKFDAARGGTIFLDEIGELPLAVQGKLLRVLQDREYLRVGGTEPVTADVRVVAATNRDLETMVAERRFREDLYFRIKVVELALPPLRERGRSDIERLARHFLLAAARRHGRTALELTSAAVERLCHYAWPGNVRELENCIESAVVIADGTRIDASDLPLPERLPVFAEARVGLHHAGRTTAPPASSLPAPEDDGDGEPEPLEVVERRHILAVLRRAGGNQTLAAQLLGIGRNTLARKLKAYGEG
jgi:Nif-specific regulatory protein